MSNTLKSPLPPLQTLLPAPLRKPGLSKEGKLVSLCRYRSLITAGALRRDVARMQVNPPPVRAIVHGTSTRRARRRDPDGAADLLCSTFFPLTQTTSRKLK